MAQAILYEIALCLLALVAIPRMLYQRMRYGKYRNALSKRFGCGFPDIQKGNRPLIWIHAASVGETRAIATLAKQLKSQMGDVLLIISSVTETGHVEAQRSLPFADFHVYLPFDLYGVIAPIIERVRPNLLLFSETDLWYQLINQSKKYGAFIAVVNGKISEKSVERWSKVTFFYKLLFSKIDLFCVQNDFYLDHFQRLGIERQRLKVTGNMKFDAPCAKLPTQELQNWRTQLGIGERDPVIVLGSTHDSEEVLLLDVLDKVWENFPNLKVLIVPRHPERFSVVGKILAHREAPYIPLSEINQRKGNERVILINAMGLLRKSYQLANISVVCGSYIDRIGGHNIIEPCWYGVPVLFGPYMHKQKELVTLVKQYHAGLQVPIEKLSEVLNDLLSYPERCRALGEGGKHMIGDVQGATERTLKAVSGLLLQKKLISRL